MACLWQKFQGHLKYLVFCQTDHLDIYCISENILVLALVQWQCPVQHWLEAYGFLFCFSVVLKWHQKPPELSTRQCSKINILIIMLACKTKVSCYPHVNNLGKHVSRICKKYEAAGLYCGCKRRKTQALITFNFSSSSWI